MCDVCGAEESLPFVCTYCGRPYCSQHRLPENHSCPEYWKLKLPRTAPPTRAERPRPVVIPIYNSGFPYGSARTSVLQFSRTERRDIVIGTALVAATGLSLFRGDLTVLSPFVLGASTVFFTLGFILHELAHKFAARHYGMWAEFRLNFMGALLTLISIVSPFKIIAPGAVVIAGNATLSSIGLTALVGPLINIGLVFLLFPVSLLAPHSVLAPAAFWGAYINSFMAVFNLIPIAILDGQKIFKWSKPVWAVVFLVAALLTVSLSLSTRF